MSDETKTKTKERRGMSDLDTHRTQCWILNLLHEESYIRRHAILRVIRHRAWNSFAFLLHQHMACYWQFSQG